MSQNVYIGNRYVPKLFVNPNDGSNNWINTVEFESLTVVSNQGNSYTSRQKVPVGIDISNTLFWVKTSDYNAQVAIYEQNVRDYHQYVIDQIGLINNSNSQFKNNIIAQLNEIGIFIEQFTLGNTTDAEMLQSAIAYCTSNNISKIRLKGNKIYNLGTANFELPIGLNIEGAQDAFYGFNTDGLSIITTQCVGSLFTCRGANKLSNFGLVYTNQTYQSNSMIDTGITFDIKTNNNFYCKGGIISGVSVCGGTTIISNLQNSDYFAIKRISFTPNSIKPSIIMDNGYDLCKLEDIHCNQNVAWLYKNGGIINSELSDSIISSINNNAVLFEIGRIDELQITRPFSYGVPYPIKFTQISNATNGGTTLNNAVFDKTYQVITIDEVITNFGIQINGLKSVFGIQDGGCLFHFTSNAKGSRLQSTNIYTTSSYSWKPCIFDNGSESNRVNITNFNFYNPQDNIDNGNSNLYSAINGYGGNNGLFPINTLTDMNSSFSLIKANAKTKIQAFEVSININQGSTTATQSFPYPDGTFKDSPIIIATLKNDNVGSMPISVVKVLTSTNDSFTLKWDSSLGATASGVWIVEIIAIGN